MRVLTLAVQSYTVDEAQAPAFEFLAESGLARCILDASHVSA